MTANSYGGNEENHKKPDRIAMVPFKTHTR